MNEELLIGLLGLETLFLFILLILVKKYYSHWKAETSKKMSVATTHGRIYEQFFPFLNEYPYDPREFRFLGTPVDGVQFEKDRIVFVEFKSANSRLTGRQKNMRDLVEAKRVEFREFYLK